MRRRHLTLICAAATALALAAPGTALDLDGVFGRSAPRVLDEMYRMLVFMMVSFMECLFKNVDVRKRSGEDRIERRIDHGGQRRLVGSGLGQDLQPLHHDEDQGGADVGGEPLTQFTGRGAGVNT